MLIALENNDIAYEFIDPETQAEAGKINAQINSAKASGDPQKISQAHQFREQKTIERDFIMIPEVIKQAELYAGGVIFFVGFAHTHAVKLLEQLKPDYFRYALFSYNERVICPIWNRIHESAFRDDYYQNTKIRFFDLGKAPSFQLIESECGLTLKTPCDKPQVGLYLNQTLEQEFEFQHDEEYVVTATCSLPKKDNHFDNRLRQHFPGLRFFSENYGETTRLTIPGINLPEHHDTLSSGFRKLGIMK